MVAPVLQEEVQLAAQHAGREAAWDLQQNAQNAAQVAGAPPPGGLPQVPLPQGAAVPPQLAADREVAGIIGEQGLVQDLLDPEVPGPHHCHIPTST